MQPERLIAAERALQARSHRVIARYRGALNRTDEELDSREIEAIENATELWDARLLSLLSDADLRLLIDIFAALRRIDEGGYGNCVGCGRAIDPDRLTALPEAALCIGCADLKSSSSATDTPASPLRWSRGAAASGRRPR